MGTILSPPLARRAVTLALGRKVICVEPPPRSSMPTLLLPGARKLPVGGRQHGQGGGRTAREERQWMNSETEWWVRGKEPSPWEKVRWCQS